MSVAAVSSGVHMDRDTENFPAMLAQFRQQGIQIERYDFDLQPAAFAQNAQVRVLLEHLGTDVLPVILWDGTVQLTGRYPTLEERLEWLRIVGAPA